MTRRIFWVQDSNSVVLNLSVQKIKNIIGGEDYSLIAAKDSEKSARFIGGALGNEDDLRFDESLYFVTGRVQIYRVQDLIKQNKTANLILVVNTRVIIKDLSISFVLSQFGHNLDRFSSFWPTSDEEMLLIDWNESFDPEKSLKLLK